MTACDGGSDERTTRGTKFRTTVLFLGGGERAAYLLLKAIDLPAHTWREWQIGYLEKNLIGFVIILRRAAPALAKFFEDAVVRDGFTDHNGGGNSALPC